MRDLLAELNATLAAGRSCAWCAVVATRGSTPRKPGAVMLVFPDGGQSGTLGGGCVEAEVKRRALGVLHSGVGRPEVQRFDLDDVRGWDDGLICGGQMTILVHPLLPGAADTAAGDFYRRLHALVEKGSGFTDAVVMEANGPLAVGDRYLFDANGAVLALLADQPAAEMVAAHLPPLAGRRSAVTKRGIAYLGTPARITLLLVGGGHVSQAVATLAASADFQIWVLDDREQFANQERFPSAERIIVGDIGRKLSELAPSLTPASYALVMTRGHNHDEEALSHLAGSACGYVGMIGSKRKVRLIFDDLASRGVRPDDLQRVRAPVGVAIGSQTVPEIAISIIAELIAWRNLGADSLPSGESIGHEYQRISTSTTPSERVSP
jgi:xanthine dehydrogenase accessory factor